MTEPLPRSIFAVGTWALGVSALIYMPWWLPALALALQP